MKIKRNRNRIEFIVWRPFFFLFLHRKNSFLKQNNQTIQIVACIMHKPIRMRNFYYTYSQINKRMMNASIENIFSNVQTFLLVSLFCVQLMAMRAFRTCSFIYSYTVTLFTALEISFKCSRRMSEASLAQW